MEIKVIILVGFLVRFFIRGDMVLISFDNMEDMVLVRFVIMGDVVGNYDDYLGWWFEEFWRNFIVVIFDFLYENYKVYGLFC